MARSKQSRDAAAPAEGAEFPLHNGARSSTRLGKQVFAGCVRDLDTALADTIAATGNWREGYLGPCRDVVAVAAQSAANAMHIASNGLRILHEGFVFGADGTERNLAEAVADPDALGLAEVEISGRQEWSDPDLVLPYRRRHLAGSDIRAQLSRWTEAGIAEPSFESAMANVLAAPEWLDLRGVHIVLLGAGAELGPLAQLLQWGADVWAVDLPRPAVWQRLISAALDSPGTLHVPVPAGVPLPEPDDFDGLAEIAGANIITQAPQIRRWLDLIDGPFVLGNYGYADGALHVRLSMACDAIAADVTRERNDVVLAYLATPTDAFAVPEAALATSRERWRTNKVARATRRPLRLAGLFQPNYQTTARNEAGDEVGIADCIVPQQGPNYLLAKRLQRFRAVVARNAGIRVSLNVAPATRTVSVVKNKALAAAYAGADRFGIEVFEPDTCNTAMAALLVRDLRDGTSLADPANAVTNQMDLFADAANHGGLWRVAYDPRSVLGVAAVLGMIVRSA
jgi:hypothetical protein